MKPNNISSILSKLVICSVIAVQLGLLSRSFGQKNPATEIAQNRLAAKQMTADVTLAEAQQLNQQVIQLNEQGKYAEAIPLAQKALAITQSILGPEHPDVAATLNTLAGLYRSQGNYPEAEPLYRRSLAIREQALGPEHLDVATSLNNLAGLYRVQGNYPEAEPLYQRSLAILEQVLGANHPDVAASLNNLAALYQSQGNYLEAESLYQRSLTIKETVLGPNHPGVASSLNNLAKLYQSQGNYLEAESLYKRSLTIKETVLGLENRSVATSLNNLATLYRVQGNYTEAEPLYQRSLAIYEQVLGPEHPAVATSLNNLALLYRFQGNYTKAEPLYQRSLAIYENVFGPEHPSVAASLNNLATLYRVQGNYPAAQPLYQRSLAIRETMLGPAHPSVASSLNNLGLLYQFQGDDPEAESLYRRSLAIREGVLGSDHPDVATSLNNLARLRWGQGNISSTISLLTRSTDIEEKHLATFLTTTGDEARKRSYLKTFFFTTNATVSLSLKETPQNLQAAHLALTTILRRKGRILDALSDTVATLRKRLNPADKTLLDQLAHQRTRLASLVLQGARKIPPQDYQLQIKTLEKTIKALETTLSQHSATFRTESQPITIQTIQTLIPSDAALIEFILYSPYDPKTDMWGEPRYGAYLLQPDGTVQVIDLGAAKPIDRKISTFLEDLQFPAPLRVIKASARELDQLIMEPVRKAMRNTRHFLIAPDGQLNLLPFNSLIDRNDSYLVENYLITELTSGRDLLKLQNPVPARSTSVIVANPDYEGRYMSDERAFVRRSTNMAQLDCCDNLEGTAAEANAIKPLLPAAKLYTENRATVDVVKNVTAPSILHLATHGFFLENQPTQNPSILENIQSSETIEDTLIQGENPLLRSGLVFAGFNPSNHQFSGVLTALEATSLDLWGTKLVVLSACKTGVGDVQNGEGVYGLRRAFVLAGAESLLMSLWNISDDGTKELMVKYYGRLVNNVGRSEALRQTQLELLHSKEYQHPFYWAAFIAAGDWRSINISAN